MNQTQHKILDLASSHNLANMTLREIAGFVGVKSPQLVQHHINQLIKKNLLWIDRAGGKAQLGRFTSGGDVLKIPVMGVADCGPARSYANDQVQGFLSLSPSLFDISANKKYFAIRAVGNSMDNARIKTPSGTKLGITDGNMVIVEKTNIASTNDYIVAIVDGLANIKRLVVGDGFIKLESESNSVYEPIYLEPNLDNFVAGKVIGVIKD